MTGRDKKQLFVVGNGPIKEDMSDTVDASDFVVRFNEPKASIGMSGTKTDWLFVVNSGKSMQHRLEDPHYLTSPFVSMVRRVFLVYHPEIIRKYHPKPNILSRMKGRRADWTVPALAMFGRAGKEVTILPPAFYENGCDILGIPQNRRKSIYPSTGFFGISYVLGEFGAEDWRINVCGFTWEGWKRHAWGDERRWIEGLVAADRLKVWS